MKKYIGVKIITAEPMKLGEYNKLRGVCVDKDDAHYDDAGYKVVYRVPWLASQTDMLADDWVIV